MPKVVISYRRSDTLAIAGRIYDKLISQFGEEDVFMDTVGVPIGVDFRLYIQKVLMESEIFLVVVGEQWIGEPEQNKLHDHDDYVRVEIESAISRGLKILPILIGNATMPTNDILPSTIAGLQYLNAAKVDEGRDFHLHMNRVLEWIETVNKEMK